MTCSDTESEQYFWLSCLNFSFPEWGFNAAHQEQKGLRDNIVPRINKLWQLQKRKKQGITLKEGRSVCNVRRGSDVGHNSSFFPMTHAHTGKPTWPYQITGLSLLSLCTLGDSSGRRVPKHPDCPSLKQEQWDITLSLIFSQFFVQ